MGDGSSHTENNRITLRVGQRLFYTTKETLTGESDYFAARLARSKGIDPDGSYFIGSDPTLLEVILRYLRTGTPPLFFDPATQTYDLAKYAALLSEARYFQIPSLVTWVVEQKYFQVIQVNTKIRVYDEESFQNLPTSSSSSTSKVEYFQTTGIERRFVCPLASVEAGHVCYYRCWDDCKKAGLSVTYEDRPYFRVLAIARTVTFDPEKLEYYG
ncbi:unnamed protein product [Clonostachys chloroleuca]|uniref:BTB domain-containing protein n=1 Tax=Clonostachys chloroleuca TaxID=1926264 RepID=A0AA35MJ58_9HYPO|nr:unnamed protein product [Clonostachys chloroleuca]